MRVVADMDVKNLEVLFPRQISFSKVLHSRRLPVCIVHKQAALRKYDKLLAIHLFLKINTSLLQTTFPAFRSAGNTDVATMKYKPMMCFMY
jgi:hypothetical protein